VTTTSSSSRPCGAAAGACDVTRPAAASSRVCGGSVAWTAPAGRGRTSSARRGTSMSCRSRRSRRRRSWETRRMLSSRSSRHRCQLDSHRRASGHEEPRNLLQQNSTSSVCLEDWPLSNSQSTVFCVNVVHCVLPYSSTTYTDRDKSTCSHVQCEIGFFYCKRVHCTALLCFSRLSNIKWYSTQKCHTKWFLWYLYKYADNAKCPRYRLTTYSTSRCLCNTISSLKSRDK